MVVVVVAVDVAVVQTDMNAVCLLSMDTVRPCRRARRAGSMWTYTLHDHRSWHMWTPANVQTGVNGVSL